MNRLSVQEFVIGFTAGLFLPLGIITCLITGTLWMLGGTYYKPIRRVGVPVTAVLVSLGLFHWSFFLVIPLGFAVLCLGDGYPDPFSGDAGSWLGQQVARFIKDDRTGGLITKLIPVVLLQVAFIPIFLRMAHVL